jgi:hypothetical protein
MVQEKAGEDTPAVKLTTFGEVFEGLLTDARLQAMFILGMPQDAERVRCIITWLKYCRKQV